MLRIFNVSILAVAFVVLSTGCNISGNVEFVADPPPPPPASVPVQVVQGAATNMTAGPGYRAHVTLQAIESKELSGGGYRAVVQPVIRR